MKDLLSERAEGTDREDTGTGDESHACRPRGRLRVEKVKMEWEECIPLAVLMVIEENVATDWLGLHSNFQNCVDREFL